jgi:thiosulfate reductase cytochrome b subunit
MPKDDKIVAAASTTHRNRLVLGREQATVAVAGKPMMADTDVISEDSGPAPARAYLFHRHALAVRVTHWINAIAIVFLIGTGLNIFNAHPALYWGQYGAESDVARRWLQIGSANTPGGQPHGFVRIGNWTVRTTGVLGLSDSKTGRPQAIAYPHWATFPSNRDLATARNFHFFFAWVLVISGLLYLGHGVASGHFRNNLLPRLKELRLANIRHDIISHARLKFPRGEDAKRYHILQKLAYGGVVFVVIPLIVLTGLGMSPGINATWPFILDVFGGRASSRSLHWIAANLVCLFILVHLAMVVLAGPYNEIRSMITGKFRIDPENAA